MKLAIIVFAAVAAFAQTGGTFRCADDPSGKCVEVKHATAALVDPPKPKVIDKSLALKFWRANALASQAESLSIKAALDHKAKAADADTIFKSIKEFCGKDFIVNDNPSDGLVCEAKPVTPAPSSTNPN